MIWLLLACSAVEPRGTGAPEQADTGPHISSGQLRCQGEGHLAVVLSRGLAHAAELQLLRVEDKGKGPLQLGEELHPMDLREVDGAGQWAAWELRLASADYQPGQSSAWDCRRLAEGLLWRLRLLDEAGMLLDELREEETEPDPADTATDTGWTADTALGS